MKTAMKLNLTPAVADADTSARVRVLAIASCGGHWKQLLRLSPAFAGCDVVYASVGADRAGDVRGHRFLQIPDASRSSLRSVLTSGLTVLRVVLAERPDVIVSTGACPGLLGVAAGKLLGARTVFIDSVANASRLSLSGRLARWCADLWLTQWSHLASPRGPAYIGSVL